MRVYRSILLIASTLGLFALGCHSNSKTPPEAQARPAMIEDVTWQLVELDGAPAEPVAADTRAPVFRLDASDLRISGYTGLNQFNGGYLLHGAALTFSPAAVTRRAGPEPLMRQEATFMQALSKTTSWRAAGDGGIEWLDADGKPLAKFNRAPA